MNLHYYQGPYEYTSGDDEIRASDMVVPEPVYEEETGNTPEELHIEEQIEEQNEEQIDEQIDEQAEEQIDGVERVPPYSRPPFSIGSDLYNPQTKKFLNRFGVDDIILIAVIILFLTDSECDNVLLIILAFLFLIGLGEDGALI